MHIDELMKNYKPLYPDSGLWEDTFKMLSENPDDVEIVQELLADLKNHGEFREPVILTTEEEHLASNAHYAYMEGNNPPSYIPYVSNGTHRLYAHHLSGNKEVKVQHGLFPDGEIDFDSIADFPMLASNIVFPADLHRDKVWEIWDKMESFKLNDDIWISTDLMSTHENNFRVYWEYDPDKVYTLAAHIDLLEAKVTERLERLGFTPTIRTAVIHSQAEDDKFFDREPRKPRNLTWKLVEDG